jgi:chemotaxis protein methyltransferase CheR
MMRDECTSFLQWALPHLRMRWPGFRRVRSQVCKRIVRRLGELEVEGFKGYRDYLEAHDDEWPVLARLSRITISRFWRDCAVFEALFEDVVPTLTELVIDRGEPSLRCWSCGCASGEEPYSLRIGWDVALAERFPTVLLEIVATDADRHMLDRARRAVYPRDSIRDLPLQWQEQTFEVRGDDVLLQPEHRTSITWLCQDVRSEMPDGPFHVVLCRNLVFTYYEESFQLEIARRLADTIFPGGALVVGSHESLPPDKTDFEPWAPHGAIHRRRP